LGVAAVAAGGYYVYKKLTEEDEAKTRVACSTSRITPESDVQWVQDFREKDSFVIVMTVDAAPGKCAGILRLPRHRKLYYYSFNWAQIFNFSKQHEPDKFEMLNALVATLAFEHYIRAYQSSYDRILLQTDNSFASLKEGRQHKDPINRKNFGQITTEMSSHEIPYKWDQVNIWEDADMWNANQLSRNSDEPPFRQPVYGEYREKIDISHYIRKICVDIWVEELKGAV
jgi:hypothetical protein